MGDPTDLLKPVAQDRDLGLVDVEGDELGWRGEHVAEYEPRVELDVVLLPPGRCGQLGSGLPRLLDGGSPALSLGIKPVPANGIPNHGQELVVGELGQVVPVAVQTERVGRLWRVDQSLPDAVSIGLPNEPRDLTQSRWARHG